MQLGHSDTFLLQTQKNEHETFECKQRNYLNIKSRSLLWRLVLHSHSSDTKPLIVIFIRFLRERFFFYKQWTFSHVHKNVQSRTVSVLVCCFAITSGAKHIWLTMGGLGAVNSRTRLSHRPVPEIDGFSSNKQHRSIFMNTHILISHIESRTFYRKPLRHLLRHTCINESIWFGCNASIDRRSNSFDTVPLIWVNRI